MKLKDYSQIKETIESLNQYKDVRKSKAMQSLLEDCREELAKLMRKSFNNKYDFLRKEELDVNEFMAFLLDNAELISGWEPEIVYIIAHGMEKAAYVNGKLLLNLLHTAELEALWQGLVTRKAACGGGETKDVSMAEDCLQTLVWDIYFHYQKFSGEFWEKFNSSFFDKWKAEYPYLADKAGEALEGAKKLDGAVYGMIIEHL